MRNRQLSHSWYPNDADDIKEQFLLWSEGKSGKALSAVVPHAGWFFSGDLAFRAIEEMDPKIDCILLCGGHLSASSPVYCWEDPVIYTPLGVFDTDIEKLNILRENIPMTHDPQPDNSVEILLPMIRYHFKEAKIIVLRIPPRIKVVGDLIASCSQLNGHIGIIGSTDLTHYGPNYGHYLPGNPSAEEVLEKYDRPGLDKLSEYDLEGSLNWTSKNHSACSWGGALAAGMWAQNNGIPHGRVLEMKSSYFVSPSTSFVSYGTVVF